MRLDPSSLATLCALQRRLTAAIAQLGERQTEDLKVPGSIPGLGILLRPGIVSLMRDASLQVLQSETIAV